MDCYIAISESTVARSSRKFLRLNFDLSCPSEECDWLKNLTQVNTDNSGWPIMNPIIQFAENGRKPYNIWMLEDYLDCTRRCLGHSELF